MGTTECPTLASSPAGTQDVSPCIIPSAQTSLEPGPRSVDTPVRLRVTSWRQKVQPLHGQVNLRHMHPGPVPVPWSQHGHRWASQCLCDSACGHSPPCVLPSPQEQGQVFPASWGKVMYVYTAGHTAVPAAAPGLAWKVSGGGAAGISWRMWGGYVPSRCVLSSGEEVSGPQLQQASVSTAQPQPAQALPWETSHEGTGWWVPSQMVALG